MKNKEIAGAIRNKWALGYYDTIEGGLAEFKVDGMTLRCVASPDKVANMADKYDNNKGPREMQYTRQLIVGPRSTSSRFSIAAFRGFVADGEMDNAVEYAKNYGVGNLPVEVQVTVRQWT
jgi:hypothetical protein